MFRNYVSQLFTRCQASLQLGLRLISDPRVYLEFLAKPWPHTLALFLVVTGLIGGLNGIRLVHQSEAELLRFPQAMSDEFIVNYPPNLVIHWQNKTLTLDPAPTQPVIINQPAVLAQTGFARPFAIYDPAPETSPSDLARTLPNPPLFIINQHRLWTYDPNTEQSEGIALTEVPLLAEGDQTWNKTAVVELLGFWVAQIRHWLKAGLFLWPLISVLGTWWSRLWFVMTEGTLLWVLSRLVGWRLGWRKLTKLACLIVPVAEVINWVGQWLYPDLGWSLFHITFWLLMAYLSLQFPRQILNLPPKQVTP